MVDITVIRVIFNKTCKGEEVVDCLVTNGLKGPVDRRTRNKDASFHLPAP